MNITHTLTHTTLSTGDTQHVRSVASGAAFGVKAIEKFRGQLQPRWNKVSIRFFLLNLNVLTAVVQIFFSF
jgi:hypothetical protein